MTIDLIITTYKPGKDFLEMLDILCNQSLPINKIIIMNTEQKYFERIAYEKTFLAKHNNIEVRHVSKLEFDCGKTRNMGVKLSDADYFLMISQNAMPVGRDFLQTLYAPFEKDSEIGVTYACQLPAEDANIITASEKKFLFPETSHTYSDKDLSTFGPDIYFISNGAALYKRSVFDKLNGFSNHGILNEDILYGAALINAGYKIAYVAEAKVLYSKNRTLEEYEHHYFDLGVSHAKHPEVYAQDKFKENSKILYKATLDALSKVKDRKQIKAYKKIEKAKKKNYKKGRKYRQLPMSVIYKLTGSKEYWKRDERLRDRSSLDAHAGYGRSEAEIAMIKDNPLAKN